MTEFQGVIGRIQLKRIQKWTAARIQNAQKIVDTAMNLPSVRTTKPAAFIKHAWYKCYLFVNQDAVKPSWNRNRKPTPH